MQAVYGPDSAASTDVFTDWQGGRLSPDTLSYHFENSVKASGLPYTSLHGLRHCWATLALQAGVPVQVVSEMLGHRTVNVTWNIYQHVIPSQQAEAAAMVAAL
jgi:integrase